MKSRRWFDALPADFPAFRKNIRQHVYDRRPARNEDASQLHRTASDETAPLVQGLVGFLAEFRLQIDGRRYSMRGDPIFPSIFQTVRHAAYEFASPWRDRRRTRKKLIRPAGRARRRDGSLENS
jgi:hypothetical protein